MCMMNTIDKTYEICKQNDIGISKNAIRQLAKQGKVPCVTIGKKILINYEGLINFLNNSFIIQPETTSTGISRINV